MNHVVKSTRPLIVGVGGLTSEVGKTTLLCDLLHAFPGWEAIKTTRGHYRSCGKNPQACCVSHLLSDEPVVRSGREETYTPGKDTGRYWDAGAANVHWVIATDGQVAGGIKQALDRVKAGGVLIDGNSFTEHVDPDFFVMVVRPNSLKIKATARKALNRISAVYLSGETNFGGDTHKQYVTEYLMGPKSSEAVCNWSIFTPRQLPQLISLLRAVNF